MSLVLERSDKLRGSRSRREVMRTITLVIAAVVATAALALATAGRSANEPGVRRLTLVLVSTAGDWTQIVDRAPAGDSPGDDWLFHDTLVNAKRQLGRPTGAAVGHSEGSIRTVGHGVEDGIWTAFLPNGHVIAAGGYRAAVNRQVQPVIGGTGDYAGAGGVAVVFENADGDVVNILDLTLPAG
jgi:hypothetical protein